MRGVYVTTSALVLVLVACAPAPKPAKGSSRTTNAVPTTSISPAATLTPVASRSVTDTPSGGVSPRDATYTINGKSVTLVNGLSEVPVAAGSGAKITTKYSGNETTGDLDGDGAPDVGVVLTQS